MLLDLLAERENSHKKDQDLIKVQAEMSKRFEEQAKLIK